MKKAKKILIADDDGAHCSMLATLLSDWGFAVTTAPDGAAAVEKCRVEAPDLVILDVRMPVLDGRQALLKLREMRPDLPVLMMTAYADISAAVECIKAGAYDFLTKPMDFARLKITLRNVLEHASLVAENASLARSLDEAGSQFGILGQSAPIRELLELVRTIGPSEASVLIAGESGTGKELVARAVHKASKRSQGPFVAVNCGALTESLLASELFGHEKGAFTGADKRREGMFVQAGGGTIFLDEIGEMPLSMQVKLLRVLQEHEVMRVGSSTPVPVDVRVVAASNRNLAEEVAAGNFREDLFYRLNVVTLAVPPLRDRGEDISLLAENFARCFAAANHRNFSGISPEAMRRLQAWRWPGNVRELLNAMERAVILMPGDEINVRELPENIRNAEVPGAPLGGGMPHQCHGPDAAAPPPDLSAAACRTPTLDEVERDVIMRTLARFGNNKTETARALGITRKTLHARLNRYAKEDGAEQ